MIEQANVAASRREAVLNLADGESQLLDEDNVIDVDNFSGLTQLEKARREPPGFGSIPPADRTTSSSSLNLKRTESQFSVEESGEHLEHLSVRVPVANGTKTVELKLQLENPSTASSQVVADQKYAKKI